MGQQALSSEQLFQLLEQVHSKLETVDREKTEPIAIIGVGCRFPGNANDPDSFWHLLHEGIDAVTEIPSDRWDIESYYDPDPEAPLAAYTRQGSFIQQVDQFDPQFFGISPREVVSLDPQQRLLLEVTWEALENAGIAPNHLKNSKTGVYVGICTDDYTSIQLATGTAKIVTQMLDQSSRNKENSVSANAYSSLGSARSMAVGRISHLLGLQGPNIQLDTACSSSLVATHLACQSLRLKECNLALVGGVNLILSPGNTVARCKIKALAPDGRCKTFDASADGYGQGEGCGVVVLKRLSDAIADGDTVLAMIRGSAINHDGPSSGLTVPNKKAQKEVIQQALQNARVEPHQVSYVEAHGTGTTLGDPIELEALAAIYGKNRSQNQPLIVGSVKTNFGHLEAAAGVSSLIKVALALHHQEIPPHLHFNKPNLYIPWNQIPVTIPTSGIPWQDGEKPRRAGVSSFGMSGSNVHVVLESAPIQVKSEESLERPVHLLTLSAKTQPALEELAKRYCEYLENHVGTFHGRSLDDICYTANVGRSHFKHRLAVLATSVNELREKLGTFNTENELVGLFSSQLPNTTSKPKIAFLFTGQGSQYVRMGWELYQTQPTFRSALEACNKILQPYLEKPLLDVLYSDLENREQGKGEWPFAPTEKREETSLLDQTAYTQPALFALEYALVQLWKSWGVEPNVVMGHSVGEYVAATVAGVFSLEDGLKLIATRGKLMQQLPDAGEMVSILASESQVRLAIAPYNSEVAIAAINGPESIVISGASGAIGEICSKLESHKVKTKRLQVSHAFHSPLMEPMLAEFEVVARQITYNQPQIPLISNISGKLADESIATAKYWVNHIRQPVRFVQSMETLDRQGYKVFLEIGSKPVLLGMGRQCLPENQGMWLPSLPPGKIPLLSPLEKGKPEEPALLRGEWEQILSSLAQLYLQGVKVDWSGFDQDYVRCKVMLPTYPFQRERYWIETSNILTTKQYFSTGKNLHPLLGKKLNCAGEQQIFTSLIGEKAPTYLSHHRVFNQALFPTTAYLEIALAAGNYRLKNPKLVVEELIIQRELILPAEELISLQTILIPSDNQSHQLQIFTQLEQHNQEEQKWILHATVNIRPNLTDTSQTRVDLEKYQAWCSQPIEVKQHYQQFQKIGIDYGSSFQGIEKMWSGANQALAEIKLPEELIAETIDYQFHPALLDAALQVITHALPQIESDKTYLPVGVEQFQVYGRPGLSLWAIASVTPAKLESQENLTTEVTLVTPEGEIIATVKGFKVKLATQQTLLGTEDESITNWLYEVEWRKKGLLGRLLSPDFLLKPVEVEQKLTPSVTELVTQVDNARTSEIGTALEELSIDYIVQALQSMGWSYKPTESFEFDAAAQHLGIVPIHRRLFQRLLQILAEAGILQSNQQQWQVKQTLEKVNPTKKNQSLQNQYPDEAALTILDRCASQLSGVLRGAIDPLELVFPQGELTASTQLYQDSPVAQVMNTILQKAITKAMEKLPPSQGIRLLEIGAGTGGTTSYILPHLNPNQTKYIFTDIGALFTSKAQEKFQDYRFLGYQALDIEVDPTNQGFESHQYDVIIAANVLHATTDMKQTLSHVRQLLAPGGMLVLYEATTRTRWGDLTFGLLEGWWKFTDYDIRPDYPLLSRDKWKQLLSETGFTQVVTLPEIESMPEVLSHQAVIVAQAEQTVSEKTSSEQKHWLILADTQGVAQELATQLRSMGETCTLVFAGEQYQQTTPTEFTIDYHNLAEFEQLIATISANLPSIYGVVQCWTMDAKAAEHISSQELKNLSIQGCGATLSLVQALVKGGLSKPPRLWLVTCGAQPIQGTHPDVSGLAQSSVWGMGKVIGLEHPELNCVRIDLDLNQTLEAKGLALFQEVWSEDTEDQVVWQGDDRYVARLIRSHPTTEVSLHFREDATYLITGSIDIFELVGRWMVSKGAKHLVLMGNYSPDDGAIEKLTELELAGAEVVVELADVSEVESIARVLNNINHSRFPLAGVIHAAGILSDGILQHQTWSSFEKVMTPKVQGAWHLHELTQNQPLDFFVLFSSVASLFGSPSQGNHSAANAVLDSLAHYRRGIGLPGLSIHWGDLTQVGEAVEHGAEVREQKQALGSLTPTQMLESLGLLMSSEVTEVGVVPINWSAWQERVAQWLFLKDWEKTIKIASPQQSTKNVELIQKLATVSTQECKQILIEYIQQQVGKILLINASNLIDPQQSILELGFDSLTGIELRSKLESQLEVTISAGKIQEGPSIIELAEDLTKQLTQDSYSNSKDESKELVDKTNLWIAYHQPKPNARLRLFCFHPWGSSASMFQGWSDQLLTDIEVLPIQLPGRQRRLQEKPFTEFVPLIQVLGEILSPYLDRPFAFFGHSMGALIAFELAHLLEEDYNLKPLHLFLSAALPPSDIYFSKEFESFSQEQKLNYFMNISEIPKDIYDDPSLLQELINVFKADLQLLQSYSYVEKLALSCPISSFGGINDSLTSEKQLSEWSKYTSSTFEVQMFPGKHMFLKDSKKLLLDTIAQILSIG